MKTQRDDKEQKTHRMQTTWSTATIRTIDKNNSTINSNNIIIIIIIIIIVIVAIIVNVSNTMTLSLL